MDDSRLLMTVMLSMMVNGERPRGIPKRRWVDDIIKWCGCFLYTRGISRIDHCRARWSTALLGSVAQTGHKFQRKRKVFFRMEVLCASLCSATILQILRRTEPHSKSQGLYTSEPHGSAATVKIRGVILLYLICRLFAGLQ